jgi:hypothetical protein
MLSSTDDFPELWRHHQAREKRKPNRERAHWLDLGRGRADLEAMQQAAAARTCPPTTATEGSASQSEPSPPAPPPWSPRTVHARWIRFTSPIRLPMVAILGAAASDGPPAALRQAAAVRRRRRAAGGGGI